MLATRTTRRCRGNTGTYSYCSCTTRTIAYTHTYSHSMQQASYHMPIRTIPKLLHTAIKFRPHMHAINITYQISWKCRGSLTICVHNQIQSFLTTTCSFLITEVCMLLCVRLETLDISVYYYMNALISKTTSTTGIHTFVRVSNCY